MNARPSKTWWSEEYPDAVLSAISLGRPVGELYCMQRTLYLAVVVPQSQCSITLLMGT